jgi:2-amino-4-hydroxy-6-hydroxymethyldihydropteridine diphosphokinase
MKKSMLTYVGVGANLGDAEKTVCMAMIAMQSIPDTTWKASSSLFSSAPIDATGDNFINAVVVLDTLLDAEELLRQLQKIEQQFGRQRPFKNAPRTLDLDLLLFGNEKIETETLSVPHPRITERAFVLHPLQELNDKIEIPGKGPAIQYLKDVADQIIYRHYA